MDELGKCQDARSLAEAEMTRVPLPDSGNGCFPRAGDDSVCLSRRICRKNAFARSSACSLWWRPLPTPDLPKRKLFSTPQFFGQIYKPSGSGCPGPFSAPALPPSLGEALMLLRQARPCSSREGAKPSHLRLFLSGGCLRKWAARRPGRSCSL